MIRLLLLPFFIGMTSALQAGDLASFFSDANTFFKKYTSDGRVNYSGIKREAQSIESLYRTMGTFTLSRADAATLKAFYINAYNLCVIYSVVKHYPVPSPMDIPGFFDKAKHIIAGEQLTLNDLEKKKLLEIYGDARIHFVLVCAAKSCPPLADYAYVPDNLEHQLNERTTLALNDPSWLRIRKDKNRAEASKLFEWYKDDFIANGKSVIAWINQFRKEKIPLNYSVTYYEYDWGLNDTKSK